MTFRLLKISRKGEPEGLLKALPEMIKTNCSMMAEHYKNADYAPPWIGYIAVNGDTPVGGGAFISAPVNNQVEIAYYTVPEYEGQGFATLTAQALIRLSQTIDKDIQLIAHTLPEENASTKILVKSGFKLTGTSIDPDEGEVWQWQN